MDLSRRKLLTASALLLATPVLSTRGLAAAGATGTGSGAAGGATPGPAALGPAESGPVAAKPLLAGTESNPLVLCWNENPYGPSPAARAVINSTIAGSCRYPDEDIEQLVALLAQNEGVAADHIVVGSGSGELLCALGLLNGHNGGEIIAAEPTYAELTDYAKHAGAQLKFVPVDKQLNHDLAAMRAAVSSRTRAIYLCNPNNPTGTAISADAIGSFVQSLPDSVTTIVDEAYLDFADNIRTTTGLVKSGKRVVVLRTFSKIHGMAGVRCGYAITRPDLAAEIAGVRMASPNIFAMRAARASLGDQAFLTDTRRRIIASRTRITDELSRLGLAYGKPQTNFVFFNTGGPLTHFQEYMKSRHILVGRLFPPYDHWCRITIGTEPEVDAFLQGLRAYRGQRAAA